MPMNVTKQSKCQDFERQDGGIEEPHMNGTVGLFFFIKKSHNLVVNSL
jgi:hypothetical protein